MSFGYQDEGTFGSRREALDWARRNNIDPNDVHIRENANGKVDAGVRRSQSRSGYRDTDNDRKHGFFE